MMLMTELSQACWECSSLSITRLLQAVLLSDFNYKLVAILTFAGTLLVYFMSAAGCHCFDFDIITTSVPLKCGLEQQKDHLPKRRKKLGTSYLFSLNINIIFIKTIVKLTYHLIFQRKHELNAVNLTSAQSFPPFGEVVLLLLKSTLQRQ